ncbi:MAG: histidinol-phosphate transaminase [Eubacteriales bacterium]|nr:histidinol-phosphate transaminase [Eubacteriales bacterium]MDD3199398.1 histidinol-phosphate transaminase [Eubacteriales bacterium]MDD4629934.1 histidinol-phosphate transaminase [Eubacteriales bacterium]
MTYELNDKVKNLIPYDAVTGNYQVRLDANESFLDPMEALKEEFLSAVADVKFNRYPDPMAAGLCEKFARHYGIDPETVVPGNGSDELITVIMGAFLRPGDKVLTFAPDFSMYNFYGQIYEKTSIVMQKKDDLILTAADVIGAANDNKPAAIILSNPCSPTSLVMSREDVLHIVKNTEALVILDEAYMDFSDQSVMKDVEKYDNLILLKTCSKALGLAAIRLGFAISSKQIVRALHAVRSPYNVNAMTQAIGSVIFSHPEYINKSIEEIKNARDYLYTSLMQFKGNKGVKRVIKPDTNFVFIELRDTAHVHDELKKRSIIVRQLGDFLRITAGTKKENDALIQALSEILTSCADK